MFCVDIRNAILQRVGFCLRGQLTGDSHWCTPSLLQSVPHLICSPYMIESPCDSSVVIVLIF